MRYILIFSFLLLGISNSAQAQADAIEQYFEQYMEDERFTVVYVSSKMFQMISKLDIDEINEDPEAKAAMEMVNDLRGLRVLTTDENAGEFYKEAITKIDTDQYEVLMTVRDGDENVRIWVKENNDVIDELLLLVGGDEDFVMLSFMGKIDLNKISKLANQIDVKGAEHLDKVGDDKPANKGSEQ